MPCFYNASTRGFGGDVSPGGQASHVLTEADRILADLAARQHGVFTTQDARDAKLSHGQIDRRSAKLWVPMHAGVFRMPGTSATWKASLIAACMAAPTLSAISHRSAAALYELPGGRTDVSELTCKRWLRAQHPDIIVHESRRFGADDVHEVDGIPVMRPERVLLDLAGIRPHPRYLEAVVQAARRKRLLTFESTKATFDQHARRGVRGVRALRIVLDSWDPDSRPTESEMETLLIQVLRKHGLPEPTAQFEVLDAHGQFVARVDAAFPAWRIAIEYDSKQEHSDEFQIARDDRRRNRILGAGYAPLVARYRDLVTGGEELYREIRDTQRNWRYKGTPTVPE